MRIGKYKVVWSVGFFDECTPIVKIRKKFIFYYWKKVWEGQVVLSIEMRTITPMETERLFKKAIEEYETHTRLYAEYKTQHQN